MNFTEFKPHPQLAPFIDAYWDAACENGKSSIGTVLPDGCVDIIINLGEDYHIISEDVILKSGKAYLGGAITHFMEGATLPSTHLVGVRFKPAAFSHFYLFSSMHEVTNKFEELSSGFIPAMSSLSIDITTAFDAFYYNKIVNAKRSLLPVIETVKKHHGDISITQLASMHYLTVKQLQRNFKYQIGLSPKEFANIIRFRSAHQLILKRHPEKTFADIAFECGYSDQAHLSNEIKKYTGVVPTSLCQ